MYPGLPYDQATVPPPPVYEAGPTLYVPPTPVAPSTSGHVIVVQQQPTPQMQVAQVVTTFPDQRFNSYIVLACCSSLVNPLCGLLAVVYALVAISDENGGNMDNARRHANVAMRLSITGILLFLIVGILVGIMVSLVVRAIYVDENVSRNSEWYNDFVGRNIDNFQYGN